MNILFYTDDPMVNLDPDVTSIKNEFGLRILWDLLTADDSDLATFQITFIDRHEGGHARNRLTAELLNGFDQVWFFGVQQANLPPMEPENELTDAEVAARRFPRRLDGWPRPLPAASNSHSRIGHSRNQCMACCSPKEIGQGAAEAVEGDERDMPERDRGDAPAVMGLTETLFEVDPDRPQETAEKGRASADHRTRDRTPAAAAARYARYRVMAGAAEALSSSILSSESQVQRRR